MRTEVILSTYNGTRYLQDQLDSIRLQSMPPSVVSIVDDKSTDSTYAMIINYINRFNLRWSVKYNSVNQGWMQSFGHMLLSSTGDLIYPCDQDDKWDKRKIETMTNIMLDNPGIDVLASTVTPLYEDGSRKMHSDAGEKYIGNRLELFSDYPRVLTVSRPGCTYCVRRSFVDEIRDKWSLERPHDMQLWMYAATKGTLGLLNVPLVVFRRHSTNASARKRQRAKDRAQMLRRQIGCVESLIGYNESLDSPIEGNRETLDEMKIWLESRVSILEGRNRVARLYELVDRRRFYPSDKSLMLDIIQALFPRIQI